MPENEAKVSNSELREQAQIAEAVDGGRSVATPVSIVAQPVRRYRARLFQGYLLAATVGFAVLFFYAHRVAYFDFDLRFARWLQHWHTYWLDVVMEAVSQLGFTPLAPLFVLLVIGFTLGVGLRWEALMLLFAGVGVGLLSGLVKLVVQRVRPAANLVNIFNIIEGYSFPSGHVMLFTVFFGFVWFLVYTLTPRSWMRTCGMILLAVLIALVGLSRVYLGHHWPSDVIGAYLLGSLWLVVTVFVYRKGKKRFFVHQSLAPAA